MPTGKCLLVFKRGFLSKSLEWQVVSEGKKVKVKGTLVEAQRLCTGRTAYRGSRGIGKGKVHRCTGTEALYRPYGP